MGLRPHTHMGLSEKEGKEKADGISGAVYSILFFRESGKRLQGSLMQTVNSKVRMSLSFSQAIVVRISASSLFPIKSSRKREREEIQTKSPDEKREVDTRANINRTINKILL